MKSVWSSSGNLFAAAQVLIGLGMIYNVSTELYHICKIEGNTIDHNMFSFFHPPLWDRFLMNKGQSIIAILFVLGGVFLFLIKKIGWCITVAMWSTFTLGTVFYVFSNIGFEVIIWIPVSLILGGIVAALLSKTIRSKFNIKKIDWVITVVLVILLSIALYWEW